MQRSGSGTSAVEDFVWIVMMKLRDGGGQRRVRVLSSSAKTTTVEANGVAGQREGLAPHFGCVGRKARDSAINKQQLQPIHLLR